MSATPTTSSPPASASPAADGASTGGKPLLLDLTGIDLSSRLLGRREIERFNPHRGVMALLDWVVWSSADFTRGVGLKHVREDEFWVPGHFPGKPMLPGVLMVEAGAQLASYLYNARFPTPRIAAFIKIEDVSFRNPVVPGDDLYLLCREVKFTPRRFSSEIQGVAGGRVAFEAAITGMAL